MHTSHIHTRINYIIYPRILKVAHAANILEHLTITFKFVVHMLPSIRPLQFARHLKSAKFCLETFFLPRNMTEKVYVLSPSLFA